MKRNQGETTHFGDDSPICWQTPSYSHRQGLLPAPWLSKNIVFCHSNTNHSLGITESDLKATFSATKVWGNVWNSRDSGTARRVWSRKQQESERFRWKVGRTKQASWVFQTNVPVPFVGSPDLLTCPNTPILGVKKLSTGSCSYHTCRIQKPFQMFGQVGSCVFEPAPLLVVAVNPRETEVLLGKPRRGVPLLGEASLQSWKLTGCWTIFGWWNSPVIHY